MKRLTAFFLLVAPLFVAAQTWHISQTFGTSGTVLADPAAEADVAMNHHFRPNGKLLLGGEGYNINTNAFHAGFVQIDTVCGTLDTTFGTGGVTSVIFEQRTRMWHMTLQPDGKIIGCGMIAPNNFGSQQWPGAFRLHADGSIDSTFNGTGYHRFQFNSGTGDLGRCFVNSDGSIVCTIAGFTSGIGAVRFLSDGTMDGSYGSGGVALAPFTSVNTPSKGTGVQRPDGSIVSITTAWSGINNDYWIILAQFDAAGVLDPAFGTGGMQSGPVLIDAPNTPDGGLGASLLADGRIIVSGTATGPNQGFLMARFLADGTPDSTYATNGVSMVDVGQGGRGTRHELLPDGSTRQYGFSNGQSLVVARDANGALIGTFGSNGIAAANTGLAGQSFLNGLTMADGRIIGYGTYSNQFSAVRMTSDATADLLPAISAAGTDLVTTGSGALQWYLDGNELVGATGNTITPTANGTYTVGMTLSPDCIYTSAPYVLLNVGVAEHGTTALHLQGNMVTDALVVMNNGARTPYDIVDARGRTMESGTLQQGTNTLSVDALVSGSYLLRTDGSVQRFVVVGR